jgi:hypothetical protein
MRVKGVRGFIQSDSHLFVYMVAIIYIGIGLRGIGVKEAGIRG